MYLDFDAYKTRLELRCRRRCRAIGGPTPQQRHRRHLSLHHRPRPPSHPPPQLLRQRAGGARAHAPRRSRRRIHHGSIDTRHSVSQRRHHIGEVLQCGSLRRSTPAGALPHQRYVGLPPRRIDSCTSAALIHHRREQQRSPHHDHGRQQRSNDSLPSHRAPSSAPPIPRCRTRWRSSTSSRTPTSISSTVPS